MLDRRGFLATGSAGFLWPAIAAAATDGPIVSRITIEDGRLWIAATIGASKPYLFVIDTGAGFCYLRPDIAKTLGLRVAGGNVLGGLGKQQVIGAMYIANDVIFGGQIRQSVVAFAGYEFGRGIPADAAGLVPAGIVTSRDSDLDFEAGEWRLWPHGRPDRDGFVRLDSKLATAGQADRFSDRIYVTATVGDANYRLLLDTGAPAGVLLFPAAAKRSGLFRDDVPFAPAPTSGFGGAAAKMSRRVRVSRFAFGPLSIDRPLITVMDPAQTSRLEHDGLIGLSHIGLLTLSTDVRGNCVWAKRNARPVPAEDYRMAGLWLDRAKDGSAVVAMVGTGSPAAQAGIHVGDTVTDPPTFEQAIRRIGGGAGKPVTLGLNRDGQPTNARFTIAPYL